MRKKLIAGNWKMNTSRNEALALATSLLTIDSPDATEVVVFPPFIWLEAVSRVLAGSRIAVGAQDCSAERNGAYTGQISADMVRDLGQWVIVGHSERRRDAGETSELVGRKALAAIEAGLQPIICVGESLESRQAGNAESFVGDQLKDALISLKEEAIARIAIAYEPIWAIGTGVSASADDAQRMSSFIRGRIAGNNAKSVRVLYGGSVVPENAGDFLSKGDVDGLLVGGASLKSDQFRGIISAC